MAYPKNSWAILPATDAIFNKTKVTLEQAMLEMGSHGGECTILLCIREDGQGKTTPFFLSSAGRMEHADGTRHKAHHDQNFRSYGMITVLRSIVYKVATGLDGKNQVVCTIPDFWFGKAELSLESKAPLFVFK